jgi:hypothetical protein
MPQRAVLQLAVGADDGALAVGRDLLERHVHGGEQLVRHVDAHRVEQRHHREDVGLVAAGKGIGQHRTDGTAHQRRVGTRSELVVDVLDMGEDATDFDHEKEPCFSLSKY